MHDDIYTYTKPKQVSSERLVRCWRFVYVVVTQLRKKLVWENTSIGDLQWGVSSKTLVSPRVLQKETNMNNMCKSFRGAKMRLTYKECSGANTSTPDGRGR